MIGQLRGTVLEKQPPSLLLDVNGVGYEIDAPMSTFYHLPACGQDVLLHTHFVVREDAQHLYGFYTREERQLFRILLKVNGVGSRLALIILSKMSPDAFVRCVANQDTDSLISLPGVGKKTADRLIIEMRDRLTGWSVSACLPDNVQNAGPRTLIQQDAVSALVALGYKAQEASRTISRVDDGRVTREEMIRRALQEGVG